jgi:2-polyprenyl-3-methyl-5-hydroxy-6-metoxy-1,4-benzoquinol methylase
MNKFEPAFQVNEKIKAYLKGDVFSNSKKFQFEKRALIPNRIELLKLLLKNKTVLHFGCCDHEELIEEKIQNNTHLQVILSDLTRKCTGIDNNISALNKLKSFNIENCYYYDLFETQDPALESEEYDYVLLGEILEHVTDPVLFLKKIREKFTNAGEIIITVPNAFSSRNFYNVRHGIEEINTDHKFWFTPYTVSKVITEAGYQPDKVYFVDRSRITPSDKIVKWYYLFQHKNPFTSKKWNVSKANGLVAVAGF